MPGYWVFCFISLECSLQWVSKIYNGFCLEFKKNTSTILIKGIVIYGPATALSLLTPLSTEVSVLMIGIIATFYTVNSF